MTGKKCVMLGLWNTANMILIYTLLALMCTTNAVTSQTYRHGGLTHHRGGVTTCGGYVNGSQGFIQTPNFPRQFPVPISCQWLIHSPPASQIILYFTQYYMRESFKLTEYDFYESERNYRGRNDLGEINFEEEYTSLIVYKPYLLLRFQVEEIGNIHLRVDDFLLDVYGFNITYEIVEQQQPVRPDACSVFKCSFLGNCFATKNFETYKCHCFPGYFGDECQYGPYCDPANGMNMCRNGGRCRYFAGSLVNTCECAPGFQGAQCESKVEGYIDTDCNEMGCTQKCIETQEGWGCECEEGYRLLEDNKTCVEKGRMRYYAQVRFPPHPGNGTLSSMCTVKAITNSFTQQINDLMLHSKFSKLREFQNLTILNVSHQDGRWYIEFFFMGEKSDKQKVWVLLEMLIAETRLCGVSMDQTYRSFDTQPALHSMSLQNFDGKPVQEGRLLTLDCKAKGSDGLQFKWFKDGAPINVHRTERNMWEMKIPSHDGETRRAVLNIDKAHALDEGEFKCQVTDWGEVKEKSIQVKVIKKPHVEVSPLSVSVLEGEVTTCTCLSRDDETGNFKYTWYRDGEVLSPSDNQEVAEDLFPTGSRLTIRKATFSDVYTCIIDSKISGRVMEQCQITVTKNMSGDQICPEEVYNGIVWSKTAANSTDVQRCPQNEKGKAMRRCLRQGTGSSAWKDPNLTACTSLKLEAVQTEFDKLRLGYIASDTKSLYNGLAAFIRQQDTAKPMMGDLEQVSKLLYGIQDYACRYYGPDVSSLSPSFKEIIGLASMIFERGLSGNSEERMSGSIGGYLMKLMDSIRRDQRWRHPPLSQAVNIQSKVIDLRVQLADLSVVDGETRLYSNDAMDVVLQPNPTVPKGTRRKRRTVSQEEQDISSVVMLASSYLNLAQLLSNDSLQSAHQGLNSRIITIGPAVNDLDFDHEAEYPYVHITFKHYKIFPVAAQNASYCMNWRFIDFPSGEWSSDRCNVVEVTRDMTVCRCQTPGHFALTAPQQPYFHVSLEPVTSANLSLVGCVICLICSIATLTIRLCLWSKSKLETKTIVINFCVAIICLNIVFLLGLNKSSSMVLCQAVVMLISLYHLVAFTFLLLEAVCLFCTSLKRLAVISPVKIVLTGWGFPVLVIIILAITSEAVKSSSLSRQHCWLHSGKWEVYAFCIIAISIILAYTILMLLLLRDLIWIRKSESKLEKRKNVFQICRSVILMSHLILSCVTSVVMVNHETTGNKWLFAIAMAVQGLMLLILHGVLHLKRCSLIVGECHKHCIQLVTISEQAKGQLHQSDSSGSFRSFIPPQSGFSKSKDSQTTTTTDSVAMDPEDPEVRDRVKYTKERKDQLKALLGTGSAELEFPVKRETSVKYPSGSRSTEVTICHNRTDGNCEGDTVTTRVRYNQNVMCACSKCGSTYPFRPNKGRAYISEKPDDTPLLAPDKEDSVDICKHITAEKTKNSPTHMKTSPKANAKRTRSTASPKNNVNLGVLKECATGKPLANTETESQTIKISKSTDKITNCPHTTAARHEVPGTKALVTNPLDSNTRHARENAKKLVSKPKKAKD